MLLRVFVISLSLLTVLFCLSLQTCRAEQNEDGDNPREAKIFDKRFWKGLEDRIQHTSDAFRRVSDNLEMAVERVVDSMARNPPRVDYLQDKIDESIKAVSKAPSSDAPIEAVLGSVGPDGNVDPGLQVFYDEEGEGEEPLTPAEGEGPHYDDHHFGFGFEGSLFRPFASFSPFSPNRRGDIFHLFGSSRKQWWNGPNVCTDEEEIDESEKNKKEEEEVSGNEDETSTSPPAVPNFTFNAEVTSCNEESEKYTCVRKTSRRGLHKTITITHRCCHGFKKTSNGCTKIELLDMVSALESLDLGDFLTLVKSSHLQEKLNSENLTVFAPSNEAVQEFLADLQDENDMMNNIGEGRSTRERRQANEAVLEQVVLAHLVPGFRYAGDLEDEQVLPTSNPASSVRINTYSSLPPSVTVNCARLVTANQHSEFGVIHTIESVLTPVINSIADIIANDPKFSILNKLMKQAGLQRMLSTAGQMTLFAPTDEAFAKLPPDTLQALLQGSPCLQAVLEHHILPNTICTSAIQGKARTLNLLEEFLMLERDIDDEVLVEDAKVVTLDEMATNGVVHVIDKPIIPQEAKPLLEVLKSSNLTSFLSLIKSAEMQNELNAMSDVTVFAPSNEALGRVDEVEMEALKNDPDALKEFVNMHLSMDSLQPEGVSNNHVVDTMAGHPLRINLYSRVPLLTGLFSHSRPPMRVTAACSRVSTLDSRSCGGVVHVVEEVLRVPQQDVLQALKAEQDFTLFTKIIEDVGLAEELSGEGPFTVLAPSDHALRALPEDELKMLLEDYEVKEHVVKRHILEEHVCCSGINSNVWLNMDRKRSMDGSTVHMRKTSLGRLMADGARITSCGAPAHNGLVHAVNQLLVDLHPNGRQRFGGHKHRRPIFRTPVFEMFLG